MRRHLLAETGKRVVSPSVLPVAGAKSRSLPVSAMDTAWVQSVGSSNDNYKEVKGTGVILNLEEVLAIEDKFQRMMDGLRKEDSIVGVVEEYWKVTESCELSHLSTLFMDSRIQKQLHTAQLLEVIGVGLIHFFASAGGANSILITHLKNLLFYLHQNFLTYIEVLLLRLHPDSSQNIWVKTVLDTLKSKRLKRLGKCHLTSVVRQQSETIGNIARGIATTLLSTQKEQLPIFLTVLELLRTGETLTVERARGVVRSSVQETVQYLPPPAPEVIPVAEVCPPFLPPAASTVQYTLVLDLDETLVHYFEVEGSEGSFKVRPFCEQFLDEMFPHYEIVIFTAAVQDYADWVLDKVDSKRRISHRLYRQHTQTRGSVFLKDLKLIGRNLAKTVIVDNVAENFQLQKDNGIFIRSWFDDMNDKDLLNLIPLLREIAKRQVRDVRVALRLYRDQLLRMPMTQSSHMLL